MQDQNNAYVELMTRAFDAHHDFRKAVAKIPKERWRNKPEPIVVTKARDLFFEEQNRLWNLLLTPLQLKFQADPKAAADEVIDFLAVDIPAFRCGYLKEFFLKRLKATELTPRQKGRLLEIGLNLCRSNTVRREFRRWKGLLRLIADAKFIRKLENENTFAARMMLTAIRRDK